MASDRELLEQSRLFDRAFYTTQYRDVACAGVDPIEHYLEWGANEGRRPHPGFDGNWYLRHNPDVALAGLNPLVHYLRYGAAEGRRAHKVAAVYSAIFDNHDDIRVPLVVDPELDYLLFVDEWIIEAPAPWILVRGATLEGGRLAARYIKTHPHIVLPDHEVSVWIDAAFQIRNVQSGRLESLLGERSIAAFPHPDRDCAYEEAAVLRQHGSVSIEAIDRTTRALRSEAYPEHAGLIATGFLIRRHRDARLVAAMDDWWEMIRTLCVRDQLSVNLALARHGISGNQVPGLLWVNEFVEWVSHRPPPWRGLQCGGAYLDAEEYEAIEEIVKDLHIKTAVEIGAGETSILFAMLQVKALSIESLEGPWLDRARAHGCQVLVANFDERSQTFDVDKLWPHGHSIIERDLLFIDSPVGTERRKHILEQMLSRARFRYVMYHDVRRDLSNIFRDQQQFGLRLERFVDSPRGLAVFEVTAPAEPQSV